MSDWPEKIWSWLAGTGLAVAGWIYDQVGVVFYLLLLFMILDTVMGILCSLSRGDGWSGTKFTRGWIAKTAELIMVMVAVILGRYLPELTQGAMSSMPSAGALVASMFAVNEVRSIVVNYRRLGGVVPAVIDDIIEKLDTAAKPKADQG